MMGLPDVRNRSEDCGVTGEAGQATCDRVKPKSKMFVFRFLVRGAVKYARSCAKNCVKVLIGRKPYFTYQDTFFRLYLRHLLGLQPIRKVTCIGFSGEGAGSQALMIMRAINFARACGLTYVHTPFAEIRYADRPMREWVGAWEAHFNLGLGEVATNGDNREVVNFAFNFDDLLSLFGIDDFTTHTFHATIPEFRRKYYSNKPPPRTNEALTVGVHVRRGDAHPVRQWTSTSSIAETIAKVRAVLDTHRIKYKICVFSQGDYAGIAELNVPGTDIFLDADPIWSMQEAIEADILIMAKSAFSYVSALISDGIKICEYEWHSPPLSNWVIRGPNGEFDNGAFERQLLQYVRHANITSR